MSLEKERNERKRRVIAHAWHVSNALQNSSSTIRTQVEKCKSHEIGEWELVESVQQEVHSLFVECGLTEMFQKFMEFAITEAAMQYSMSESAGESKGTD